MLLYDIIQFFKNEIRLPESDIQTFSESEQKLWNADLTELESYDRSHKNTYEWRLISRIIKRGISRVPTTGKNINAVYNRAEIDATMVRILAGYGAIKIYGFLAERLIYVCLNYAFCDIGRSMARLLELRYRIHEYSPKKCKRFTALHKLFDEEANKETEIERCYAKAAESYQLTQSHSSDNRFLEAYEKTKHWESDLKNPKFYTYKYLIQYNYYVIEEKQERAKKTAEAALEWFNALSYEYPSSKIIFYNKLITTALASHNYADAERYIDLSNTVVRKSSLPWLQNLEMKFLIHIRQLKYSKAKEVLQRLMKSKNIRVSGSQLRDRIQLYKLYYTILCPNDKAFRAKSYYADLDRFRRDKSGMNITVIIAELLGYVVKKDATSISMRKKSVQTYIDKYCLMNPRSRAFVKMILNLPYALDSWHKFIRHNNRLYKHMKNANDAVLEIEIVDYAILWPFLCQHMLKGNKRYEHQAKTLSYGEINGMNEEDFTVLKKNK